MLPRENDDALSAIMLGNPAIRSPGVVVLSGHDRVKNWDIQKAKGQTGATSKLNGDDLGEFEATFHLSGDGADESGLDDFELWEGFQLLLETMVNGPRPVTQPIYHPDLVRNHFTEVTVRAIGGMVHDSKGGATVKVRFGEHRPPKPKPPAKAKPGAPGGTSKPDPNAAAKQELAALLTEAKKP
jgi:hypothetical protein